MYTMNTPTASFDAASMVHLRPMALPTQAIGTAFCLGSLLAYNLFMGAVQLGLYGWVLLSGIGMVISQRSATLHGIYIGGLIGNVSAAVCFGALANAMSNPALWFLPVGLCLVLSAASLYHHLWHFPLTCVVVWATLWWVIQPQYASDLERVYVAMVMLSSACVGMIISLMFRYSRRQAYDLQRQLHAIANIDALTNLPNRRAFMSALQQALAANEPGKHLHFLMLDIDDFKKINDNFGHEVGDLALIEVARVIEAQAEGHYFARLGGEEFAVIAHLDTQQAGVLAQSIVDAVNAKYVQARRLSISSGMAPHESTEPAISLMRRADAALYDAKHAGKNGYRLSVLPPSASLA